MIYHIRCPYCLGLEHNSWQEVQRCKNKQIEEEKQKSDTEE